MNNIEHPIFIVEPARSGTTMLQRLLNSFDGVYITGEHHGALTPLLGSYKKMLQSKKLKTPMDEFKNPKFNPCWERLNSDGEIKETYKELLKKLFNPKMKPIRWGFKEIAERYPDEQLYDDLISFFPNARFLFIVRNIEDVLGSRVRMFNGGNEFNESLEQTIRTNYANFIEMAHRLEAKYPNNTMYIQYEKMLANPHPVIDNISKFIQVPSNRKAIEVMQARVN